MRYNQVINSVLIDIEKVKQTIRGKATDIVIKRRKVIDEIVATKKEHVGFYEKIEQLLLCGKPKSVNPLKHGEEALILDKQIINRLTQSLSLYDLITLQNVISWFKSLHKLKTDMLKEDTTNDKWTPLMRDFKRLNEWFLEHAFRWSEQEMGEFVDEVERLKLLYKYITLWIDAMKYCAVPISAADGTDVQNALKVMYIHKRAHIPNQTCLQKGRYCQA